MADHLTGSKVTDGSPQRFDVKKQGGVKSLISACEGRKPSWNQEDELQHK